MKLRRILALALLSGVCWLQAEDIALPQEGNKRSWNPNVKDVTVLEDGAVRIDVPKEVALKNKGGNGIFLGISLKKYAGTEVLVSAEIKQENVFQLPGANYSGRKFMAIYKENGKTQYPEAPVKYGTADWEKAEFRFKVPAHGWVTLFVGVQGATGTVYVRNLKIEQLNVSADFSKAANMGFADAKEKDGVGGWTDQGPENDGAGFDFKKGIYANVPFRIVNPEENGGKSVLVFQSVNFPAGISTAAIPAAAGNMKYLYLLHTAGWAEAKGAAAGSVIVKGTSGEQKIDVQFGRDLGDQWNPSELPNGLVGAVWNNRAGGSNGLYVSRFPLKDGLGKIQELVFEKGGANAVWIVAGATLAKQNYPHPLKKNFVIRAGERFQPLKRPATPQIVPGSALDFSELADGKIERVIINKDGRLARINAPEVPFRFFGAEVSTSTQKLFVGQDDGKGKLMAQAFWSSKEDVSALVREVKRHGCNMMRLHGTGIVSVKNGKAILNPEKIDLFDWCVAECRKAGIYIQIDTIDSTGLSGAPNPWAKGVREFNAKFRILFNERIRRDFKTAMKTLLEHVNPYTGTTLRDDPVLAVINCFNEQEFAFIWELPWDEALPEWRKFTGNPSEPLFTRKEWNTKNEKGRKINEFITMKWREILVWYRKTLRDEIGYKGLLTLWEMTGSMHYNNLRNDLECVMAHAYHAHTTENCTALAQGSDIEAGCKQLRTLLDMRVAGRPFMVNEYASVFWNRYRYEEAFAMGAYAGFQGIDMLSRHGSPLSVKNGGLMFPWTMFHDPVTKASFVQSALLYGRRDVQEGGHGVRLAFSEKGIAENKIWPDAVNGAQSRLALIVKYGLERVDDSSRKPENGDLRIPLAGGSSVVENTQGFAYSVESKDGQTLADWIALLKKSGLISSGNRSDGAYVFESSTGELYADTDKRFMTVNTPRFQGVCGEAGASAKLNDVSVKLLRTRGIASVASLQKEKSISNAERLLIVYATNALNSGMTFADESMRKCLYFGGNPTLVETGRFRVEIRNRNAENLRLYSLRMNGARSGEIKPVSTANGVFVAEIDTAKLPDGPALYFELAK